MKTKPYKVHYKVRRKSGCWVELPVKITDAKNGEIAVDTSSLKPGIKYTFTLDLVDPNGRIQRILGKNKTCGMKDS